MNDPQLQYLILSLKLIQKNLVHENFKNNLFSEVLRLQILNALEKLLWEGFLDVRSSILASNWLESQ